MSVMNIMIFGCGNVGFETAKLLCRDHRLLLVSHRLPTDVAEFVEEHHNVSFALADATDSLQVEELLAGFCRDSGSLDAIVSTVGTYCSASPVQDMARFENEFRVNFRGIMVPVKAALNHMLPARAGKIVILSSTSGVFTYAGMSAYAPAKWAITGLCESLAKEIERSGVSVSVICPASIRNRRSRTFHYERGIEASRVAACTASLLERTRSTTCFVPRRHALLRPLEQNFSWILEKKAGLLGQRRQRFRSCRIDSALILGASSSLRTELARLYAKRVKNLYLVEDETSTPSISKQEIPASPECRVRTVRIDDGEGQATAAFCDHLPTIDLVIMVTHPLPEKEAKDCSISDWELDLTANFYRPVRLLATLLGRSERPRKIVTVLTTRALPKRARRVGWTASQSAMWAFTRSLRRTHGNEIQVMEVLLKTPWAFHTCPADTCTKAESEHRHASGMPRRVPTQLSIPSRQIAERIQRAEQRGKEIVRIPL